MKTLKIPKETLETIQRVLNTLIWFSTSLLIFDLICAYIALDWNILINLFLSSSIFRGALLIYGIVFWLLFVYQTDKIYITQESSGDLHHDFLNEIDSIIKHWTAFSVYRQGDKIIIEQIPENKDNQI